MKRLMFWLLLFCIDPFGSLFFFFILHCFYYSCHIPEWTEVNHELSLCLSLNFCIVDSQIFFFLFGLLFETVWCAFCYIQYKLNRKKSKRKWEKNLSRLIDCNGHFQRANGVYIFISRWGKRPFLLCVCRVSGLLHIASYCHGIREGISSTLSPHKFN